MSLLHGYMQYRGNRLRRRVKANISKSQHPHRLMIHVEDTEIKQKLVLVLQCRAIVLVL